MGEPPKVRPLTLREIATIHTIRLFYDDADDAEVYRTYTYQPRTHLWTVEGGSHPSVTFTEVLDEIRRWHNDTVKFAPAVAEWRLRLTEGE